MKGGVGTTLAIWYVVVVVTVFGVTAAFVDRAVRSAFIDELTATTLADSRAVALILGEQQFESDVAGLGQALSVRISVISSTGRVIADSEVDPTVMDNHNGRPEVIEARSQGLGTAIRRSDTLGEELLYVAVLDGDRVVRLAVPLDEVNERMVPVRARSLLGIVVVMLAGVALVAVGSRRTGHLMQSLTASVASVAAGQRPDELLAVGRFEGSPDVAELSDAVKSMADQIAARVGELEKEQELRDRVLGALDEGVLLLRERVVDYANPAARRMLGSSISDTGLLRHHQIVGLAAGETAPLRITLGARLVEVVVGPTGNQSVVVLRDVTDLVRTEAIRRDFVADASHELKTPVAAIRAGAETIQAAADDGDMDAVKRFSAQVERSAERLALIVSDLLDLSRLESRPLDVIPVDLGQLVSDEIAAVDPGEVVLGSTIDSIVIMASPPDVSVAVRNLLTNAIRHTDPGGTIDIGVTTRAGEAVISVRDTGAGIPARDLPRIFERFYRVDAARSRQTGGTGLGLAIVRHVAERHGGRVEVVSELGVGSTFRIYFPMSDGDEPVRQS